MDNAELARTILERLYTQGELSLIDQHFDPAYRGYEPLAGFTGREELRNSVQMYRAAFPDLSITADDVVAAGDKAMVRWTARGTQNGPFLGAPATGKTASTRGITIYTFRGSKIIEEWTQWDVLSVIRELGLVPQLQQLVSQPAP